MKMSELVAQRRARYSLMMRLAGIVKRSIHTRLNRMTKDELIAQDIATFDYLMAKIKEGDGSITPGRAQVRIQPNSLRKEIGNRIVRAELKEEREDPQNYLGSMANLSDNQIKACLIWKAEHPGSKVEDWLKLREKIERAAKSKTESSTVRAHQAESSDGSTEGDDRPVGGRQQGGGSSGLLTGRGGPGSDEGLREKKESKAYGPKRKGK